MRSAVFAGIIVAFLLLVSGGSAWSFHDGGAAACEGCHTMHNTQGGVPMTGNLLPAGQTNAYLLQEGVSSDLCLNCHEGDTAGGHLVSTSPGLQGAGLPPRMLTPGGDFAWLKKTYSWVVGINVEIEAGDRHGHNIVAPDYGYSSDATLQTAPGGTYPSTSMQCISCHDPHGEYRVRADGMTGATGPPIAGSGSHSVNGQPLNPNAAESVGSYRLLGGVGYKPASATVSDFTAASPAVMAPDVYNRSEAATQTRVVYGAGTSRWCTNCHGEFHDDSASAFRHRFEETLGGNVADRYNAYVKTGDLSGTAARSFLSLVPFETDQDNSIAGRNAMAALARTDDTALGGPAATDRVGCLTCHRAHASGWRAMLRWNPDSSLLLVAGLYPGINNGAPAENHMGRTEAETKKAYYDRPATLFAANQNSLCEKCHEP